MYYDLNNVFMRRAFDLARLGTSTVSPNPSVGAVITYKNSIIGENWHKKFGEAHAEVNAINSIQAKDTQFIKKSKIFVTLEPCFHFGKTPPCVNLLLNHKIKDVNIGFQDPNPLVAGQSIQKLKSAGANVNILNNSSTSEPIKLANLTPFFTIVKKHRPYIILKWAETLDNYIGISSKPISISNKYSQRLVHKWRSEADAIMIGRNTAIIDNPNLTNRLYYGKSPSRIVIDKNNNLPRQLNIYNNEVDTIVFNEIENIQKDKTEFKKIAFNETTLTEIMQHLFSKKIGILFVEGGSALLNSFITQRLWDEARIFKSKKTLSDIVTEQSWEAVHAPQLTYGKLESELQINDNQLLIFNNP
jgi:diaminohydroxyphosphoribosylaminopyrimidine deaminase / 5-amino-6-(5-phosphoribosylamino)uracil reductase